IGAIQNITAKLKGDWAQKDLTSLQASKIAKYLVCITDKAEVDAITPELAPLGKSRNLLLALADSLDLDKAVQKSSEAVVGALLNQPLLFTKQENWRLGCRKVLLVQALELTGTAKTALTETADTIRDYYKEQGVLLGVDAAEL